MLTTSESKQGIDFAKVEMLRRHMWLSVVDMATVFGVSRITYYSWVKGNTMRATRVPKVRATLKKLLVVLKEHNWPNDRVRDMHPHERLEHLLELLGQEQ